MCVFHVPASGLAEGHSLPTQHHRSIVFEEIAGNRIVIFCFGSHRRGEWLSYSACSPAPIGTGCGSGFFPQKNSLEASS
ncbi:hypothetical protein Poly24_31520 [Rosistilla carotiformis]|uniref:Uncharacterized protein n=1 Tax=Rosistilla carotiformis TaxID=2528017 RepID=A0A518JV83_9BACT|nr:hypothetical protein Poly24_31520 [Rosistilla carotiformis]